MACEVRVPRLGWSMEEGVFQGWLKQPGDTVRPGEPLFSLEGEKAVQDIEAVDGGILRPAPDCPQVGDTVAVGALLAYLLAPGEEAPGAVQPRLRSGNAEAAPGAATSRAAAATVAAGRVSRRGPAISPRAARAAAVLGVDWTSLRGSGRTGRIRERDVLAAAKASGAPPQHVAPPPRDDGGPRPRPISPLRKTIAERMLASARQTAPVTLTTKVDATNLVALGKQFQAAGTQDVVPTFTDIIVKLSAVALSRHPALAVSWRGDTLVAAEGIHIGVAVDTDQGLLVPVVRDVPGLTLIELARRSRDLIERARKRRLSADELQGGTFTVTNLGGLGIDAFTPIINYPEAAVLGVGAIRREPVVLDDERIAARQNLTLSLTFDHRVVDGAPAARFLQTLREGIENPAAWLLT